MIKVKVGEYLVTIGEADEYDWPGCVSERWTKDGVRARPDGLPIEVYRDLATGREVYKQFEIPNDDELNPTTRIEIRTERLHYDEVSGPGQKPGRVGVGIDPRTGEVIRERYENEHGKPHREGGLPSEWEKDPDTGVIVEEWYHEHGENHRVDGPAHIKRSAETGAIVREEYYLKEGFEESQARWDDLSDGPG